MREGGRAALALLYNAAEPVFLDFFFLVGHIVTSLDWQMCLLEKKPVQIW